MLTDRPAGRVAAGAYAIEVGLYVVEAGSD